jgi:hypothetical protein
MKSSAPKRLGSITVLSLLSLLAIAIGAQAALAASSSSTAPAGTQGRGGVSASLAALAATPLAGTEGRGGTDLAPAAVAAAGTEGRGGVAALSGPATLAGETTVASNGFSLRMRGGVPRPVAGAFAAPSAASGTTANGTWVAVGIAVAALLAGVVAWISIRRRGQSTEVSMAAYCARHPEDAICMT